MDGGLCPVGHSTTAVGWEVNTDSTNTAERRQLVKGRPLVVKSDPLLPIITGMLDVTIKGPVRLGCSSLEVEGYRKSYMSRMAVFYDGMISQFVIAS